MSDTQPTVLLQPPTHLDLLRKYGSFIRAKQVAKMLGCKTVMVYALEQRGEIKGYRISAHSLRFDPVQIEQYMTKITAPGYVSPLITGAKPAYSELEKRLAALEESVATLHRVIKMRSSDFTGGDVPVALL